VALKRIWEYQSVIFEVPEYKKDTPDLDAKLNDFGSKGWELINVTNNSTSGEKIGIFKREAWVQA
jgi:FMN phosphatase YigB (HAD superfamily)